MYQDDEDTNVLVETFLDDLGVGDVYSTSEGWLLVAEMMIKKGWIKEEE